MTTQEKKPNLFLYTSVWRDKPTFKGLPTCEETPYVEIIYDTYAKGLYVVLKHPTRVLQFLPKISKDGDVVELQRPRKFRNTDSRAAEERVELSRHTEFFIEKREEVEAFLKRFCENEELFREAYTTFLNAPADVEGPSAQQMSPEEAIKLIAGDKLPVDSKLSVVQEK